MQFTSRRHQAAFSMTTICLFFCLLSLIPFFFSHCPAGAQNSKMPPLLPLYGEPWMDGAVELMRALRSAPSSRGPGPRMPTQERSAQLGSSNEWRRRAVGFVLG